MSWHFSQALVAAFSRASSSGGKPSAVGWTDSAPLATGKFQEWLLVNVLETSNDICPHCDGHGEIDLTQSELKKMRMENE
jgi:hypothetical protein